jgi:hypothetical protein
VAHGWRQIGEWFDDVDDPIHPRDPDVYAAMRRRWPDMTAFRMHTQWITPAGSVLTFWHHGVGRFVPTPKTDHTIVGMLRTAASIGAPPNVLERIFEGARGSDGKPGEFLPFTWERYYELVRDDIAWDPNQTPLEAVRELLANREARVQAARAALTAEIMDRGRDLEPYIKRQLEKISDVEWAERERAIRAGTYRRTTRTPFVEVSGAYVPAAVS